MKRSYFTLLIPASGFVTFSKANRPLLIKIKAKIKLSKYCDVTIGCIFCRRLNTRINEIKSKKKTHAHTRQAVGHGKNLRRKKAWISRMFNKKNLQQVNFGNPGGQVKNIDTVNSQINKDSIGD